MNKVLGPVESVCPECLNRVAGELLRDGDVVRMVKRCPEHGEFSSVVWRGEPAFSSWVRPKIPFGGGMREEGGQGCPFRAIACQANDGCAIGERAFRDSASDSGCGARDKQAHPCKIRFNCHGEPWRMNRWTMRET